MISNYTGRIIHDLSGAITHKREIITLYLQGYLTPEIVLKTNHGKEVVDRYIKDCHKVETLWQHGITDFDEISELTRLSVKVTQQCMDLLPTNLTAVRQVMNLPYPPLVD